VVDSAGIAHARPVTVGARNENKAEITSGLAAGETVVTTGAYGVTDSVRVRAPQP
jgi:multidrug efflux pump subunit AcrA (membrane-fusion protein)